MTKTRNHRIIAILLLVTMCTTMTACGGQGDSKQSTIHTGMIFLSDTEWSNLSSANEKEKQPAISEGKEVQYKDCTLKYVFYSSPIELLLAFKNNRIDSIYGNQSMVKYLASGQKNCKVIPADFITHFQMVLRKEDASLRDRINKAIDTVEQNGTMKKLTSKYIENVSSSIPPNEVELPKYEGAKTIKVGLTGANPPIDYTAENGQPTGFNLAYLAEIAKILKMNIQPVVTEEDSKLMALASNKIDVIFMSKSNNDEALKDSDNIIYSKLYYSEKNASLYKNDFDNSIFIKEFHDENAKK